MDAPELDDTCSENEKLVWSIVNKKPIDLEEFPIYSSFVMRQGPSDIPVCDDEISFRTRDDAINFIKSHRGKQVDIEELKKLSKLLIDEDLGDEEKLALIPILLTANVSVGVGALKFPNLPMEVQVLDEGKRNEGFASDSHFAGMK
eukprot:gnl/Chilomastix_caulleri/1520.p2 GENE.gnl/Chilomastix_caulleri/1520~~gnl/Chilomastix_caulleri/1520.p2  ORF type:complete len:146 (+),score=39.67 gnl/Chilomastix_caulleri/1520:378-815(+)